MTYILAIDQGTTSSRAILFDADMRPVAADQAEFPQLYPDNGWVEHRPDDIWASVLKTCRGAIAKAGIHARQIDGIGITNQRETTLVWDRETGEPIHNAIVWQDRRTSAFCAQLKEAGHEPRVSALTGLLLDPYFSATKLAWLLDNVPGARERAEAGRLAFGTVDSYLIWRLTGGAQHVTDATNAARTMLFDIHTGTWSAELCDLFGVPMSLLPEVRDCAADFGETAVDLLGGTIPILGVAGDQHAATIGQACFQPGMMKSTYGTGCFAMLNIGDKPVPSSNRLLTTIAYQLDGQRTYALEGSIFIAGAVVQWLRDEMGLIETASQSGTLAAQADPNERVVMVPALTGLGAPYWQAEARGAVFGLTRNSGPAEFARAALESIGFQTRDLLQAMRADVPELAQARLRVDGGMVASDLTMQFLADILDAPVDRPKVTETTALGAAWLAGRQAGVYPQAQAFADQWTLERRFEPQMSGADRQARCDAWSRAVRAVLTEAGA